MASRSKTAQDAERDPAPVRVGDRPRPHPGTSETELAIFEATEVLLADVALRELTVAQIISAAGISRATFYFYFSSKYAVLAGLLARITDAIFEALAPFVRRPEEMAPEQALRQSIEGAVDLWQRHRPALRAIFENWNTTDELRARWVAVVDRFTGAIAEEIDRQRSASLAPAGTDSRRLAATLLWSSQNCLYVAGLGVDRDLPNEQRLLEPLEALWMGTLYGRPAGSDG